MGDAVVSDWRVEELVGLEAACRREAGGVVAEGLRERVRRSTAGMGGVDARRSGLRVWLDEVGDGGVGQRFGQARALVAAGGWLLAVLSGAGVVVGIERAGGGGLHVVWLLAVVLGLPWLLLAAAVAGWMWAGRRGVLGLLGGAVAGLIRRLSGGDAWWDESFELRRVVGATVVRLVQGMAVAFQLGALGGLIGLVVFRHVHFYWESTTGSAMAEALERVVRVLSAPWARWLPEAVPDAHWIAATRRLPGVGAPLESGPWWEFLAMAQAVWGLLPRLLLWLVSGWRERRAVARVEFQSPACRRTWRALTAVRRGELPAGPADGALVIDLGGIEPDHERLRPFLLRRLRVNPVGWETLGVLDAGREQAARRALEAAPAGVVLLAEAWALSPRDLAAVVARVRAAAGDEARLVVVIGNPGTGGVLRAPADEERIQWEAAVDALGDPNLEVFSYEEVGE